MKYIKNYLENVLLVMPLGEVSTSSDFRDGLSGEEVIINGTETGIFIAHADYCDWLEKYVSPKDFYDSK